MDRRTALGTDIHPLFNEFFSSPFLWVQISLQLSITMVFLTAASITLLLTFSLMIGLKDKTLKPSGSFHRCLVISVCYSLGFSDGPADISEEVLRGGLQRD